MELSKRVVLSSYCYLWKRKWLGYVVVVAILWVTCKDTSK